MEIAVNVLSSQIPEAFLDLFFGETVRNLPIPCGGQVVIQ
jgi:hypothetical protein